MKRYFYDLHLHSCLSPCGDDDMTPGNIAGMASLNGLNLVALTDHNSVRNTPAFCEICEQMGILAIPGMEITTAEDIHIVALFTSVEDAQSFEEATQPYRILYKNPVDIYGHQYVMDQNDAVIEEEEHLLSNALLLPLSDAVALARAHGALVYPAHIDREANGIIAILAGIPEELNFRVVEFHDPQKIPEYTAKYHLEDKRIVVSSDAHYLWDINDPCNSFDFEPGDTPIDTRRKFFAMLEGSE